MWSRNDISSHLGLDDTSITSLLSHATDVSLQPTESIIDLEGADYIPHSTGSGSDTESDEESDSDDDGEALKDWISENDTDYMQHM